MRNAFLPIIQNVTQIQNLNLNLKSINVRIRNAFNNSNKSIKIKYPAKFVKLGSKLVITFITNCHWHCESSPKTHSICFAQRGHISCGKEIWVLQSEREKRC